jgi:hypothetical protein
MNAYDACGYHARVSEIQFNSDHIIGNIPRLNRVEDWLLL